MTLPNLTSKVVGSDTYNERKILATDVNQIRQAIQTGALDIKPANILMEGTYVKFNAGNYGFRYDTGTNKMQVSHDGTNWLDIDTGSYTVSVTAGENLLIRDAVYISTADGKAYKCDADDATKQDWVGLCTANINTNDTGSIYVSGFTIGGFSSLTTGAWYYLSSTAGELSATGSVKVGIAISTTAVLLMKLNPSQQVLQDQTGGTTTANTETKVGQVTIPANTVLNGVKVVATGSMLYAGTINTVTITLRGGTSTTITSNTLLKTITRANGNNYEQDFTMTYYVTGLTWTSTNYIQVGMSCANPVNMTCESIVCELF